MKPFTAIAFAAALAVSASANASTFVAGNNSGTTDLGVFAAGNYNISATGIMSLVSDINGFPMGPDGIPTGAVPGSYSYFSPNGSETGDGIYGAGGPGIRIGALMGSLIPVAPLGDNHAYLSTYFYIGPSRDVVHTGGHLYAQINDTFYSNDSGGFTVTVREIIASPGGVPEPGAWALMIMGFGGIGAMLRRRSLSSDSPR